MRVFVSVLLVLLVAWIAASEPSDDDRGGVGGKKTNHGLFSKPREGRRRVSKLFPRKLNAYRKAAAGGIADIVTALDTMIDNANTASMAATENPAIPVGQSHSWSSGTRPKALATLLAEEMQSLEENAGFPGGAGENPIEDILGITAAPDLDQVTRPIIEPIMVALNAFATADALYQAIVNAAPDVTCIAETSEDLVEMVGDPTSCFLVLLPPGASYDLTTPAVVSTFKVIMGYPVDRPVINAEDTYRGIEVINGGVLHVYHVIFYTGESHIIPRVMLRRGGCILVEAGSRLLSVNCYYTIQPRREHILRSELEFIWGGDIFITAGTAQFIRCDMLAFVIGFVNGWGHEIGGSVFMAGGQASFILTNFMTTQLFAYVVGGGIHVWIAAGVGFFVGK